MRRVTLLVFSVLFSFSQSCQKKVSLPEIPSKAIISNVGTDEPEKLIGYANTILNDNIILTSAWKAVKYEGELDWSIDPYNNSSWKNYFFCLRTIGILSQAYTINENSEYLEKGKEILYSWDSNYDNSELRKDNYIFIWRDHAVASRVINLVHFYNNLRRGNKLDSKTKDIIETHLMEYGEWLADYKNYTKGNHAVMMDRALLYLSYVVKCNNSEKWKEEATRRFNQILEEQFTDEGVCTENSPEYHVLNMNLFLDFISIIENFSDHPNQQYVKTYEKMKTYLVQVLKPDLTYPFQGDTYPSGKPFQFSEKYPDSRFDYLESKGIKGNRPKETDIVFKEAGYAILRDKWREEGEFEKMTYINFISGNPSRVHKHSDNLSFFLYANGEDLLIDPGNWGYSKNDTVSYLRSTMAHNTFLINNLNIKKFPVGSSKIIENKLEENYSLIRGVFSPNPYQIYYRTLLYIKPNILILDDQVFSEMDIESISQIFNLGTNMKSFEVDGVKNEMTAEFINNNLEIVQLLKNTSYEVNYFNGSDGIRGLYAKQTERTMQGNQFVFLSTPDSPIKNHRNITMIKINNDNDLNVSDVEFKEQEYGYNVSWIDFDKNSHEIVLSEFDQGKNYFADNIAKADKYDIDSNKKVTDFSIDKLYVHQWTDDEYSFIFKLDDNVKLEGLKKFTLGIRGYAYNKDLLNLSTYSRQTNRDFDSWNLKADEIIETDYGKFININISTNLNKFKRLKLFLFDRDGYKKELWNYEINNFFLDKDLKNGLLLRKAIPINNSTQKLTGPISIENISTTSEKDRLTFLFRLKDDISKSELEKYRLGLHTYAKKEDQNKLLDYSKYKDRTYDAWDFNPEITLIDGKKYIIKTIDTSIDFFPRVKMFLYDRDGYKGVRGETIEIENVKVTQ